MGVVKAIEAEVEMVEAMILTGNEQAVMNEC